MVDVCSRIAEQLSDNFDAPSAEQTIACLKNIPKLDLPSMYELNAPVGDGEYARCYSARDLLFDRNVIVKVLNTELSRDSPAYDKYVASAARLNHRNILGVLFSQANKLPHFLVTPALEGPTLEERLARKEGARPLSFAEAVECTMCLADALAYAHANKCVHGRLRPCEVRFDRENQPVLTGFRTLESCEASVGPDATMTLADFQYSSPERRSSGRVDAKGDQYLLGLLAYEMITGKPPVRIENWSQLLDPDIVSRFLHPPSLKSVVPSCNERVSDVIMTMLEVNPRTRLKSLEDVRPLLQSALWNTSCFEVAKHSYRRCARQTAFYKDVYDELFRVMPAIRPMFKKRSMAEQYKVLADALWLLLDFSDRPERREPTILSGIARTHAKYSPRQFDQFQNAVLKAVGLHDPDGPQAVAAWRDAMKPGFAYLKARARKGAARTKTPQ
jgi:serine/threonine protein kinase